MIEQICVWPDGLWCYECDLEELLSYKSDDYYKLDCDSIEAMEIMNG